MQKSLRTFVALCLLTSASALIASERQTWIQVEYVLFENLQSDRSPLRYETLDGARPSETLYDKQMWPTGDNKLALANAIAELQASRREYKVWSKGAWLQPVREDEGNTPLSIQVTDSKDPTRKLQGTLNIRKSRFYHAEIDVFLTDATSVWPDEVSALADAALIEPPLSAAPISEQSEAMPAPLTPSTIIHFKDSRRVRNGEINYIDHPALGLIVTVREVAGPVGGVVP